jgi:hypothetical protein
MVVWADSRNSGGADIFGQLVNADGSTVGGNIAIWEYESFQGYPVIAYNRTDNQYLVAWQTQQTDHFNHTHGRRLLANGTPLVTEIDILSVGLDVGVAHNSASLSYVVTARQFEVDGKGVSRYGNAFGSQFPLTSGGGEAKAPAGDVAYDSWSNRFLIAWRNQTSGSEGLEGQLFDNSGTLHGTVIRMSDDYPGTPQIVFDPVNGRYLVVFKRYDTPARISGQFVARDGSLIGSNFEVVGSTDAFNPDLAYSPKKRCYVVVWQDISSSIFAKIITAEGEVSTHPLVLRSATAISGPKITYNSRHDEFLVVWADSRNPTPVADEIYGQVISFRKGETFVAEDR